MDCEERKGSREQLSCITLSEPGHQFMTTRGWTDVGRVACFKSPTKGRLGWRGEAIGRAGGLWKNGPAGRDGALRVGHNYLCPQAPTREQLLKHYFLNRSTDRRTAGRTDERTDGRTDQPTSPAVKPLGDTVRRRRALRNKGSRIHCLTSPHAVGNNLAHLSPARPPS